MSRRGFLDLYWAWKDRVRRAIFLAGMAVTVAVLIMASLDHHKPTCIDSRTQKQVPASYCQSVVNGVYVWRGGDGDGSGDGSGHGGDGGGGHGGGGGGGE